MINNPPQFPSFFPASSSPAPNSTPSPTGEPSPTANPKPKRSCGAQKLPNLTGKTKAQATQALQDNGFIYKGRTLGGYEKWYHPDGSRVQIRPDGEITRSAPKESPSNGGNVYRPRIGSDGQKLSPGASHNTGEIIQP